MTADRQTRDPTAPADRRPGVVAAAEPAGTEAPAGATASAAADGVPAGPQAAPAVRDDRTDAAHRPTRRILLAGPAVAVVSMIAAVIVTDAAGVSVRDPDHVAGRRLMIVLALVAGLVLLDIAGRAARGTGRFLPTRAEMGRVRRQRWTAARGLAVGSALVSFYATYLAYRNLKSVVPLSRPGDLFDSQLEDIDRWLFFGHDPATLMHDVLGTGFATDVLSLGYGLFFIFIPGTLALALVFSRNLQAGLFYATAQSLNWLIGAGSYFALPALGPIYAEPGTFASLRSTSVTHLQGLLLTERATFLADPGAGGAQSIAAFSSLHISIFFTGVLAAHLFGLRRRAKVAAWVLLIITAMATIHLGWHYVVDDVGGVVLALAAVGAAWAITGFDPRDVRADQAVRAPRTSHAGALGHAGAAARAGASERGPGHEPDPPGGTPEPDAA
jgi:hypothetical protein